MVEKITKTTVASLASSALWNFIDELRQYGYSIGTEQYIAVQNLLIALASTGQWPDDIRRLSSLLAPLLCTSPKEQKDFYNRFDNWLARNPELIPSPSPDDDVPQFQQPPPEQLQRRLWPWMLAAIVMLLTVIAALYFLKPPPPILMTLYGKVVDRQDSTAVRNATISFMYQADSSDGNGLFSFDHTVKDSTAGLEITHPNFKSKQDTVALNRSDNRLRVIKLEKRDSTQNGGGTELTKNKDNEEENNRSQLLNLVERVNRAADNVAFDPPSGWPQIYAEWFNEIRIGATALPILIFITWWGWQIHRQRMILEKRSAMAPSALQRIVVTGVTDKIFQGPAFRRTSQQLRRRREFGIGELDAPATVTATIENGSWFTPVYSTRQVLPEYLVLIDRASFQDQQARRVEEIIGRLKNDGVLIDCYYFDRDPRVCWSADPKAPHLMVEDLIARYPDHCLMVFSDGAGFMNPLSGQAQEWLNIFSAWQDRAVLTPESPANWDYREIALAGLDFIILPATQDGLSILVEKLNTQAPSFITRRDGSAPFQDMLYTRANRYLERLEPEPVVIDRLCQQLQSFLDKEGYYWLCACAVYPMLAWDLTLYLGYSLIYGGQKLLNEKRLVTLARLPWLRHGSMPDWLRLHLISSLSKDQELAIRKALEDLLKSAVEKPDGDFVLDIAQPASALDTRAWKTRLHDFFRAEPQDSRLQDYVFLAFMSGQRPNKLTVDIPKLLRRIFFHRGVKILGVRPIAAFAMSALFAFSGWKLLATPDSFVQSSLVIPYFQLVNDSTSMISFSARSDSAFNYYVNSFFQQQNDKARLDLIARYHPSYTLDSLIGDDPVSLQRRYELYQSWLTETLARAARIDSTAFSLYVSSTSLEGGENSPFYLKMNTIVYAPPTRSPMKWALLVGINKYKNLKQTIFGAVNDVEAMRSLLIGKFDFPPSNVFVLTGEQATRTNIIEAFQSHLIINAQRDDIVVFHFSGQGSQIKDLSGDEPDGLDETIIPFDSRDSKGEVFDISDDDLNELLLQLAQKTKNITYIFDSCHSGTSIRSANVDRRNPIDNRQPPPSPSYAPRARYDEGVVDLRPANLNYVLISSCRADEVSFEHRIGDKDYGALTYFLTNELRRTGAKATYRDVMDKVMGQVSANYPNQHPQLEGAAPDNYVFNDSTSIAQAHVLVTPLGRDRVTLDAGQVHGLTVNSRYDIYAPGTRTFESPAIPLAKVVLTTVASFTSEGRLISGKQVPAFSIAIEREHQYSDFKLMIHFQGLAQSAKLQAVKTELDKLKFIETAPERRGYRLLLRQQGNQIVTESAGASELSPRVPANDSNAVTTIVNQVSQWTKWFNVLSIDNPNSANKIQFTIKVISAEGTRDPFANLGKAEDTLRVGEQFEFTVENKSGQDLYISILDLSSDGGVSVLYPFAEGASELLKAGTSMTTERYSATLSRTRPDLKSVTDVIKVFATSKPIDFHFVEQLPIRGVERGESRGFNDPLEQLLVQAALSLSRGATPAPVKLDDWVTVSQVIIVKESTAAL